MHEHSENFNKDIKTVKKYQTEIRVKGKKYLN